jgi:hypothetical protein
LKEYFRIFEGSLEYFTIINISGYLETKVLKMGCGNLSDYFSQNRLIAIRNKAVFVHAKFTKLLPNL